MDIAICPWHVFLILFLCGCLQVNTVEGQCLEPVDVVIELEHGHGTITRDIDGNYDVKILPGETMSLICAPSCVDGEYQWKREETVLYSSTNGYQISQSDPEHGEIRFEPGSPSKWDELWRLIKSGMIEDAVFSYSCGSDVNGYSNVNVLVTYDALDFVATSFNGEGEFSDDRQSKTLQYDECNTDLTQGKWSSYGDHCYQLRLDLQTFEAAEEQCQEMGALLTSIHSGDENTFHVRLIESSGLAQDAWIGFQDRDNDETYEWTDGTQVDYTKWDRYEPDWRGRNLCAYLTIDFDVWIDAPCDNKRPYLCKKLKDDSGSQPAQVTSFPTIACSFYGENTISSVRWYKNDVQLSGPDYPTEEARSGRTYELSLTKGLNSGGNYKCVADDGREGALEVKVNIPTTLSSSDEEIKFEPRSDGAPNKVLAKEGQNTTMTCTSELLPQNPTLKWFKSSFGNDVLVEIADADGVIVSQNIENNEWSLTLTEVSVSDAAIYTCVAFDESGTYRIGYDTVYITVFTGAANKGDLHISLLEPASGVTTVLEPDQNNLPVSRGVGYITLICRSSFWANEIQWLNEYGREFYESSGYIHQTTIEGWERTVTFEYRGSILSDGPHTCRARDSSTGTTLERTIEINTIAKTNIHLNEDGRTKYIEKRTPRGENFVVVFEGDTLSLTCTAKYPDDYFEYLSWRLGSNAFYASSGYPVYRQDEEYGRLSFTENESERTSTLTLTDVRKSDAKLFKCQMSEFAPAIVRVVVAHLNPSCPNSCYPETGDWSGNFGANCFNSTYLCDTETYCPNIVDEQDCPALGCGGLVKPENAYISVSSYSFGSVATYSCQPGYVPVDGEIESRVCQENGQWSGQQPTCVLNIAVKTGCTRLTSPDNGNLFSLGNNFGDNCFVTCNTGFTVSGDSDRTCQDNGEWSGEIATCQKGKTGSATRVSVVRGDVVSVKVHYVCFYEDNCHNRTVITVKKDAGPLTISCRFPGKTTAPAWRAGDGQGRNDPGSVVGDFSVSETIKDLEWHFTMGLSCEGPLVAGTQTVFDCDTEIYTGYSRIDVIDEEPFADLNTTKATITVTDGIKVQEVIEQPTGGAISYIRVNPGSTISLTCAVTAPGAILSDRMSVRIDKETPWGDGSYNSEFPIAANDYLWLSSGVGETVSYKEDRRNSEWTLTISDITEKFNIILTCKVWPHYEMKEQFIISKAHITVQDIPEYRNDRKCGPDFLALSGLEATCPGECCSTDGECGDTDEHCVTNLYKDYRDECSYGMSTVNDIDWKTSEKSCVVLIKKKITFSEARDRCIEIGATLSSIHSDEEQSIHLDWMNELRAKRAWIGLTDSSEEGRYVNIDGTSNDFSNWARREPKDEAGDEDCVHLKLSDEGKWKSIACTDTISYFCKRPRASANQLVRPTWKPTTVETGEVEEITVKQTSSTASSNREESTVTQPSDTGSSNALSIAVSAAAQPYKETDVEIPGLGTMKQIEVTKGDTISLTCTVPLGVETVSWARESGPVSYGDSLISENPSIGLNVDASMGTWTLTIEGVSESEEGQWVCGTVSGSLTIANLILTDTTQGPSESALSIEVTSAEQPYTETDVQIPGFGSLKQIEVTRGDTISLTCRVPVSDGSDVSWAREDGPISYGDRLISQNPNIQLHVDTAKSEWTLTIEGVSESDEGQWICGTPSGLLVAAGLTLSPILI